MSLPQQLISPVGIGLRHLHYDEFFATPPAIDFIEVHTENFFAQGGAIPKILYEAANLYPVSLHGVGLSLGSACGIDEWHLQQIKRLVEQINPLLISDHLSFGRALTFKTQEQSAHLQSIHANDLLPIRLNQSSLQILTDNINYVQDSLKRKIALENIVSYFQFTEQSYDEAAFLMLLSQRTGCGILLDINNVYINAVNQSVNNDALTIQEQCLNYIHQFDAYSVMEIHLAGCTPCEQGIMVDDHSMPVSPAVWHLYQQSLEYLSSTLNSSTNNKSSIEPNTSNKISIPTLIEWDTHLPSLNKLLDEAAYAKKIQNIALAPKNLL